MKPPTPHHAKHNAACPGCGEPFMLPVLMGFVGAEAECHRCKTHFVAFGSVKNIRYNELPSKRPLASWVGEPLPGDGRLRE